MEAILRHSLILQSWVLKLLRSAPVIILFAFCISAASMSILHFYTYFFGAVNQTHYSFLFYLAASSIFIFTIIPLLVNKFILNQSLSEIGLQLPKNFRQAFLFTLLGLAAFIPVVLYLVTLNSFSSAYFYQSPNLFIFIFLQLIIFPAYYFAEESFFRGFLFLTLYKKIGWHSFWITEYMFMAAHFGKPLAEIALSLPASILLNYITLKTRSIVPAVLIHVCLGIITFSLVNYHLIVH